MIIHIEAGSFQFVEEDIKMSECTAEEARRVIDQMYQMSDYIKELRAQRATTRRVEPKLDLGELKI
jgi:hypothetical protein